MKRRPDWAANYIVWWIFSVISFLHIASISAQTGPELTLHYGTVWRHTRKLTVQTGHAISGVEVGLRCQTNGHKKWQQWQRLPAFQVNFGYFLLGDSTHGSAYTILPSLDIPLLRRAHFSAFFRVGSGIARITKPYNYFDNRTQNAIGSHWNNTTQFRLLAYARLSSRLQVGTGAALTHFSNGAAALPNYGLNLPTAWLSANYNISGSNSLPPFARSERLSRKNTGQKRWGAACSVGFSKLEYNAFDGPKYPVWLTSVGAWFKPTHIHRLGFDIEMENNVSIRAFYDYLNYFDSEIAAKRAAYRCGLALSNEFIFGNLSIRLLLGRYVGPSSINQFVPLNNYSKLGLRYYAPPIPRTSLRCFGGVSLKAHAAIAEYISWHTGFIF
jgi:hypothetical protein